MGATDISKKSDSYLKINLRNGYLKKCFRNCFVLFSLLTNPVLSDSIKVIPFEIKFEITVFEIKIHLRKKFWDWWFRGSRTPYLRFMTCVFTSTSIFIEEILISKRPLKNFNVIFSQIEWIGSINILCCIICVLLSDIINIQLQMKKIFWKNGKK